MLDPITKFLTSSYNKTGTLSSPRPIVLMYHGTTLSNPSSEYSIQSDRFAEHLKYIDKNGWQTILFRDLLSDAPLAPKTIILTFDDGYANNYDGAFIPILDYGMKATWFITTSCIGGYAYWMGSQQQELKMLSNTQLKQMARSGMEIASHSSTHPDLSSLDYDSQLEEMKTSKQQLEALLQDKVSSFAYPYGKFNPESIKAARFAGYRIACTTSTGSHQPGINPMLIPRITIFRSDSVSSLARKLIFVDNEVKLGKVAAYYLKRVRNRLNVD